MNVQWVGIIPELRGRFDVAAKLAARLPPAPPRSRTPAPSISMVPEIVAAWIASREQRGVSATYLRTIRKHGRWFAGAHPGRLDELTADWLRRYLRRWARRAPRTRNNVLRVVRQIARYARRQGWVPPTWVEFDKLEMERVPAHEHGIYTAAEIEAVLQRGRASVRPLIVLVAFCGLRVAEAARLRWSEIDLDRKRVLVTAAKAKTRSRRSAPVPDNAAAWLARLKPEIDRKVFIRGEKRLQRDLQLSFEAAGVATKRNGLRHSFISYRLVVNEAAGKTALEAGTSETMLFRHYLDLVTPEAAAAWFGVLPGELVPAVDDPARDASGRFKPRVESATG